MPGKSIRRSQWRVANPIKTGSVKVSRGPGLRSMVVRPLTNQAPWGYPGPGPFGPSRSLSALLGFSLDMWLAEFVFVLGFFVTGAALMPAPQSDAVARRRGTEESDRRKRETIRRALADYKIDNPRSERVYRVSVVLFVVGVGLVLLFDIERAGERSINGIGGDGRSGLPLAGSGDCDLHQRRSRQTSVRHSGPS